MRRLVALLLSAIALLPGVLTEGNALLSHETLSYHTSFAWGDYFPGVSPQYVHLIPYLVPWVRTHGLLCFTLTMTALDLLELAMVFDVLLRVVRKEWVALALFVPCLALAVHPIPGQWTVTDYALSVHHPAKTFGPIVLLWLVSWDAFPLTPLVATLVAINNVDYGIPAFIVTAIVDLRRSNGKGWKLWLIASGGAALFLPDMSIQMQYGKYGFGDFPMPDLGMHWLFYGVFLAASVYGWRNRHSVLLWLGGMGFGSMVYYMGRSHPYSLLISFSFLGPCIALLAWETRHALSPTLAALFALMVVDVVNFPRPDLKRLFGNDPRFSQALDFMAGHVRSSGEKTVLISYPFGKLIAMKAGVTDIDPYGVGGEIHTTEQGKRVCEATARVRAVFGTVPPFVEACMADQGFVEVADTAIPDIYAFASHFQEWRR